MPPAGPAPHPYASGPYRQPQRPGATPPAGGARAARPARAQVPWWLVPTTCLLALLIGAAAGYAGGLLADRDAPGDTGAVASPSPSRQPSGGPTDSALPTTAPLPQGNGSVTDVAHQMLPSTVQVLAFTGADDREPAGTGSGFVLNAEGHVVTNNHVVKETVRNGAVKVVDSEGEVLEAEVVGRSTVYDVAVLKITEKTSLRPAALGGEGDLQVGEQVVAIGAPLGLAQTVTSGIVSALNRPVTTGSAVDEASYISAVQTDAAINPGNSGGPLMNMRGQVIGVNTAIATTGGSSGEAGSIGVGFSIPIQQVRRTVDQILATGKAQFPVIGASVQPSQVTIDGAPITGVEKGSPAARAGLEVGDVVTRVGDERVTDGVSMIVAIRTHQPGEQVAITIERDGRPRNLTVVLAARTG